jgi:hypothetical protein
VGEPLPFPRRPGDDEDDGEPQPFDEVIATFSYRHDAEYAAGFLADAEIPSLLLTDDAGGLHPGVGFTSPARLVVRAEDREEAREVLRDAGVI